MVDDGSTDDTYKIAEPYADKGLIKFIHRDDASGSKSGALNYGVLFSSGEIIISVDADTLLERGAIAEIMKPFSDKNVNAVSGNIRILRGNNGADNLIVELQAYEYVQSLELGRRFASLVNILLIISGAFGAFRKEDMVSLGVYSTDTITEDFATIKVRKMNRKIVFADKAVTGRSGVPYVIDINAWKENLGFSFLIHVLKGPAINVDEVFRFYAVGLDVTNALPMLVAIPKLDTESSRYARRLGLRVVEGESPEVVSTRLNPQFGIEALLG